MNSEYSPPAENSASVGKALGQQALPHSIVTTRPSKKRVRSFGSATLSECMGTWRLVVEPHVALKLKQLFRKLSKGERGELYLSATEENCRDLLWFTERYPLEIAMYLGRSPDGELLADGKMGTSILAEKAASYDKRCDAVFSIIDGDYEMPAAPDMILPARPYQEQAAALAINMGSLLLADSLGLGKTISAIRVLAHAGTLPAIVVCPAHLPYHWQEQLRKFIPSIRTHILKTGSPYKIHGKWPDVLISSYHKVRGWADFLRGRVKSVIFDECQELRRPTSQKYAACVQVSDGCDYRIGLSGTPIFNYGNEFHSVFHVLKPHALGTREEFVREWCINIGTASDPDKARIKDPAAFGTHLRESGMMLRRTRADVGRELPPLSRIIHEVDCDLSKLGEVESAATELAQMILAAKGTRFERMQIAAEFSNSLRQATGIAKAPFVAEFVKMLIEEQGEPVLLFGWHREFYSIILDRLSDYKPALYTGSESATKKRSEAQRFKDGGTQLLIMSLRSGSGLDGLQERCKTVVIGELDWSPGAIEQCIGRVFRDGQRKSVFAYYPVARDGSDPIVMDILGLKKAQLDGVNDPSGPSMIESTVDPNHIRKLAASYLKQVKARK